MRNPECRRITGFWFAAFFLLAAVFLLQALSGCAFDSRSPAVWGGDCAVPEFTGASMTGENTAVMGFSSPVSVVSAEVVLDSGRPCVVESQDSGNPGEICFVMSEAPGVGEKFLLSTVVEDEGGNTLSVSVTLTGFNSRLPELRINEVRAKYSKPKAEYIEFKVLKAGNLSGICVETIGESKNTMYEFPAAEVAAGEFVVLHYRCMPEGAVFKDETGSDITLSGGDGASATGRDFWFDHAKSPLSIPNVVLVRERSGGSLMDALVYTDSDEAVSSQVLISSVAEAVSAGVWQGEGDFPSFNASGNTATRTICRYSLDSVSSPGSWYICDTSKATPGEENIEVEWTGG